MGILNPAQIEVLRWVADGCSEGVMEGCSHRVSAAALKSRDLVKISGHGNSWCAEITARGTRFLQRLQAERPLRAKPDRHSARSEPRQKPLSPTEQLIADLVAASGRLRVPYYRSAGEADYQQRVLAARRFGKVPPGKCIRTEYVAGELEIRLEDAPTGTDVDALPVPVPKRLTSPHPVVKRFRDQTDHHEVSKAALGRSLRILQVIVTVAEQRGYEIENVEETKDRYGRSSWSGGNDGHLAITIRGHRYSLRIFEEKVPARGKWEREARWRVPGYYKELGVEPRIGRYDANGTGRLTISLDRYGREGRQSSWGDRKSWTLEDKLPEVLRELEVRAAEDDHRAEEARRREEERRRQWEIAMEHAKERFIEVHRAKGLREQVTAWLETKAAREYLEAVESEFSGNPDTDEWIEWIRTHIERIDPLRSAPAMPEVPEIRPEDLKPFLGGLSPYGPSSW